MPTLPITLPIHQVASERGQQPLIGLEEVLEAALLDLQQRHVRQEIVADEEAEEDKVCDQRSSFMCRNEFRP